MSCSPSANDCSKCLSGSTCNTSVTNCTPGQSFPSVSNIQSFANQQSYGAADVSWPGLLPIKLQTGMTVYSTFPGSYMDGTTYRFSRQGMDGLDELFQPSISCQNTDKPGFDINVAHNDPSICVKDDNGPGSADTILSVGLNYTTPYPYIDKPVNPNVNPCGDTTFKPDQPSTVFQYFYSASVPLGAYPVNIYPVSLSSVPSECKVEGKFTCERCDTSKLNQALNTFNDNPHKPNLKLDISAKAYDNTTFFTKNTTYSDIADYSCSPATISPTSCNKNPNLNYAVYAHMRDGFQRLNHPDNSKDGVTCTTSSCVTFTCLQPHRQFPGKYATAAIQFSSNYSKWIDNSTPVNTLTFPTTSTCSSINDLQKPSCKYLHDVDKSGNVRVKFLQVVFEPDKLNNIYFAETSIDGKTNLVKSFNIAGRFPGCLTLTEANPSKSFYLATSMSDFMHVGGTLASKAKDWTWRITRDIGSHQSGQYLPLDTTDNKYTVWDPDYNANWPSINGVGGDGVPDMVARIIFYNPVLFQPWDSTTPKLTDKIMQGFSQTTKDLFNQNTPIQPNTCDKMYVHAFERGVAFLEFISTIVYSIMYAYNLDKPSTQDEYFDVSYNVYMETGGYTMTEFLKHMYTRMSIVQKKDASKPLLLEPDTKPTRSDQDELDAWVNETILNTEQYMTYPAFKVVNNNIVVELNFHPMMHANLATMPDGEKDVAMQVYLNNFFQDFASQLEGGTTELGTTKSVGVLGAVTVQKGDNFFDGPTAIEIQVSNTTQVLTLDLFSHDNSQKYAISYVYQAQVTRFSVGSLIYLMQNNNIFQIDLTQFPHLGDDNRSLPIPMVNVSPTIKGCLVQSPLSQTCVDDLCASESNCVCDFSMVVGSQQMLNPNSALYINNSHGTCACLASNAYPQGDQISRAKNPVSACFSKSCEVTALPEKPQGYCQETACSFLMQTLHDQNRNAGDWYTIFPDHGEGIDLNKLNATCHTNFVHEGDLQTQAFKINWYIAGGSACLALVAPLVLALDYLGLNQRRSKWVYLFWLGTIIFMLVVAGLLFYALSGVYQCPAFDYDSTQVAPCVDRLTKSIHLTQEVCAPHATLFCQCKQSGAQCTGYKPTQGAEFQAQCTVDGVCALCPNDMTKIDINNTKNPRDYVPTTWVYLGVGAWFLVTGLVCFTLASYFKNLGLNLLQRIGFLTLVGFLLASLGFGCLIAGMNHTSVTTFSVDQEEQTQQASSKTDPCDSK